MSDTVKIAYNTDFGGFSLSDAAIARAQELSGNPDWYPLDVPRHDAVLVQVIEELGDKANGGNADIALRAVPRGTQYRIDEYDGSERVILNSEQKWLTAS